jgi:opacity protein-like surface antigen
MKRILAVTLLAASLAVSAQAAATVGFEAGYLTSWKEAYYSARIGYVLKVDTSISHQLEVEIGYTEKTDSVGVPGGVVTATGKIVPITLNYRAEIASTDKFGCYVGAGIGTARTSVSGSGFGVTISDSANSMTYQGFAGITYKATDTTSLHLGVKYIWVDDINILGTKAKVGDDFGVSAGISFKF